MQALDYLTKPVEPERLQQTLMRVRERVASKSVLMAQEQLRSVLDTIRSASASERRTYLKRVLVRNGTKEGMVSLDEVEWIESSRLILLPARGD